MKKILLTFFVFSMVLAIGNSYAQELILEQPIATTGMTGATSANRGDINYEVADNFSNLDATVNQVVFYGLYAIFDGLAALGIGNMVQSNTVAAAMVEFGIAPWVTGVAIVILVGLVTLGGIQRIAITAEKVVPTMA
ncbi:MAG: alanine:cation symporter family protein, partial [Bacteroidales bacterium]|nr:alanine:cation symporter family protein [Bacteroidales bacterium]